MTHTLKRRILPLILFLAVAAALVVWRLLPPKRIGGTLYEPDFKDGFSLYVEEAHYQYRYGAQGLSDLYHSVWHVTDEETTAAIYALCSDIQQYREANDEMMMGGPPGIHVLPQVYFTTASYGYCIRLLNWDLYTGKNYTSWPIKLERFGKPVLFVDRFDLSLTPDTEDTFKFIKTGLAQDSLSRHGWYSILSEEQYDELCSLLNSVSSENAELFRTIVITARRSPTMEIVVPG